MLASVVAAVVAVSFMVRSPCHATQGSPPFRYRLRPVAHQDLEHADGGAQLHRARAPMDQAPAAAGENFAVAVGFFLQTLLESLACPFAAFGFHFKFDFPQGPGPRLFRVHPFPLVEVLFWLGGGTVHTPIMGAVSRCAPCVLASPRPIDELCSRV